MYPAMPRPEFYLELLGEPRFAALESAASAPSWAVRVNTLKADPSVDWERWAAWYGWEDAERVPFCAAARRVRNYRVMPGQTLEHADGYYYVQDVSTTLPVELFGEHPAPLILDMTAAPGGKTTHLLSRYADRGIVLANDSSPSRLGALQSNVQAWSAFGALVTNFHAEHLGRWFPETFDRVLLDAPCSGETLRPHPAKRPRHVSARERERLCTRQIALLGAALQAAKVGGEIVYVTCTMAPEENEAVLDELLRRHPDAVEIAHVARLASLQAPPLRAFGGRRFHPDVARAFRLWPDVLGSDGLFTALLRKTASVPTQADAPPTRRWKGAPLKRVEQTRVLANLQDVFVVTEKVV